MKWFLQSLFFFLLLTQLCFAQWYEQNSGTNHNLYSVQFIDPNTGYAVGDTGTILNTQDGGATWHVQISGTASNLRDIFFLDENKGWAAGENVVLYTSDAGMNWSALWYPENVYLMSIYFMDSMKGWVVGDTMMASSGQAEIWYTTDGGSTWTSQFIGEIHTILFSIYFIDSSNGWVVGKSYSSDVDSPILKTTNGGIDWIDLSNNFEYMSAYSTHFTDFNNGWIVGESNAYRTTDGGISWVKNDSLNTRYQENRSVLFVSPTSGWVVGYTIGPAWLNGFIAHTTDGGDVWSLMHLDSTAFYSCDFVDSLTGWIVGENGMILQTTNGGVSFVEEKLINNIPNEFLLSQNYPNPFNPATVIKYSIPEANKVILKLYNLLGEEISTLVNEEKVAGYYKVEFNATTLPSGVYFYRLNAGNYTAVKKMILLK